LQKYNSDGTIASSWHTLWDTARKKNQVPIQEDETALVLWALWEHYEKYRDIEFAHRLYTGLVVSCADFMVNFRHDDLGLPAPSWNLWEDRRGIHTFTCATVVAGLRAAANFAQLFAEAERAATYRTAADAYAEAMKQHLYSDELGRFIRSLQFDNDETYNPDPTVDASLSAVFFLNVFAPDDPMVTGTMTAIKEKLSVGNGIARFENDGYMRVSASVTGNVWFICTLWLADYHIAAAKSIDDLRPALDILNWTVASALPSGVLAEQFDVATGEHISVSPLTWSHSTFVSTVHKYLAARQRLAA
jgi:GH15 family glucan-1,4-alpha-glucosidase